MKDVLLVSATVKNRVNFERFTYLGISLRKLAFDPHISSNITYENYGPSRPGLSEIYNKFLVPAHKHLILVFVHDDVYIDDFFLCHRVNEALARFDVVGLA